MSVNFAKTFNFIVQKRSIFLGILALGILLFSANFAFAHEEEEYALKLLGVTKSGLESTLSSLSVKIALTAGGIIFLVSIFSILTEGKTERLKKILFYIMMTSIVLPTVFFAGSTVYLNIISDTGGPVHWHLDYRILACGKEEVLAGPTGFLSNKVGTPTFHHHDDNRIHVEGTVVEVEEVDIEHFFEIIGGKFSNSAFTIPTASGNRTYKNGDLCPSGDRGTWQAFLFEVPDPSSKESRVSKLDNPADYVMKPQSQIPPGDCVVFEFGPERALPDVTCPFYDIAYRTGKLNFPTNWRPTTQ